MPTLQETITAAWKDALRAGENNRRDTISGLRAAIKNAEIEARAPLSDEAVQTVVNKEAKKRREAIEEYTKAGRPDLAAIESGELDILGAYLPAQMGDDELRALIAATVAQTGAASPKDMGMVMKALQPQIAGKADGKLASNMVKEALAA